MVSTHAPTRGATRGERLDVAGVVVVSTHAPTRGATRRGPCAASPICRFNPRAHAGRDDIWIARSIQQSDVSTHAPTRGATHGDGKISPLHEFQPTRPRGARLDSPTSLIVRLMFQPTRPRGARLRRPAALPRWLQFQPTRPRGARRVAAVDLGAVGNVSTHAPTRGATATSWQAFSRAPRFNPRAHAGRDSHDGDCVGDRVSTHAPTRGATRSRTSSAGSPQSFQPTRPRGARPDDVNDAASLGLFQPTRPRGARRSA